VRRNRLDADVGDLDVSVDVDPIVFASQDDGAVGGEGHVEALSVPLLAFECRQKLKETKDDLAIDFNCRSCHCHHKISYALRR